MTGRYRQRGEFEAWQVGDDDRPKWVRIAAEAPDGTWTIQAQNIYVSAYAGEWVVLDETGFVSVWDAEQFAARFVPALPPPPQEG